MLLSVHTNYGMIFPLGSQNSSFLVLSLNLKNIHSSFCCISQTIIQILLKQPQKPLWKDCKSEHDPNTLSGSDSSLQVSQCTLSYWIGNICHMSQYLQQQLCFQQIIICIIHIAIKSLFLTSQRKSLDNASPKLGAAMRIAMVQIMLKTLNPTRHRRSMTAAANCHCSAKLSCRSCSRTRSTRNCTSTRRACSWLSTATERTTPLWVCMAADLPVPTPASKTQCTEETADGSGSGDAGGSCRVLPNLEDGSWRWTGVSPAAPPPTATTATAAPSLSSPMLILPWLVALLLWTGSNSAVVWKVW